MHTRWRNLLALFAVLLLGAMMASPAAAQDDLDDPLEDLESLPGIQNAVARIHTVDYEALMAGMAGTPGAEADPFAAIDGILAINSAVLQFDNEDNASAAYDRVKDAGVAAMTDGEGTVTSEGDIDDLGNKAWGANFTTQDEDLGGEAFSRVTIAQDNEYVFLTVSISTTEDGAGKSEDVLKHLVNDGEASGDDVSFSSQGGSTGGLWGFFPADDADIFEGLIPGGDEILYPEPDDDDN